MSAPPTFSGLDLSTTFGCSLAGCLLACMVWGVSCLQTFLYFAMYERDPWYNKLLVSCLWVIDTVNQILILKALWPPLIQHWGDVNTLAKLIPELTHHAWVAQILEFTVQMYFIHRIYIFSGKKWLFPVCMIILSIFQLAIIPPYDVITLANGAKFENITSHRATSMVIALRSVTAAEDVLLSLTLMYLILRRGLPQFHQTRRLVVRLLVVTANTGLWTAIVAFIELALVAGFPTGGQFTVAEFPLCSLYFTSLLASLNARDYIRGADEVHSDMPSKLVAGTNTASDGSTLYLGQLSKSKASNSGTKQTASGTASDMDKPYGQPIV